MKKRIFRYLKHISATLIIVGAIAIVFGLYIGASLHYGDNELWKNLDKDGPYVFTKNDSIVEVNYIKGNKDDGFYVDQKEYPIDESIKCKVYFALDSTHFNLAIHPEIITPKATYDDGNKILAISDIEGSYKAFRDFLISNNVVDNELNWTFGNGHLVLVGDFVDRGASTTQVLWFIYKLEQESKIKGGVVHFIIGNHELKNMQGNYGSSSKKYMAVSNILGKRQSSLYSKNSFIGKWMASKNSIELINGNLFAHGGIHPEIAQTNLTLQEINGIIRENYYRPYYPKQEKNNNQLLLSNKTGICWYRGYFKDDLTQEQVENGLDKFNAKTIIVGHTLQSKVNSLYQGRLIGIDIKHPKDYHKNWPNQESEGLLIVNDTYYRVLANADKEEI